jgi:hypothetical protein
VSHLHLVGGVKFDPPADPAFPPVAWLYAQPLTETQPRSKFLVLGGMQYQSSAGSCTAHGYSTVPESYAAGIGADLNLCRQDMYFGARWLEGNGAERIDGGAYPSKVREWLRDYGTVTESRQPYDPRIVTTWRPPAEWAADRHLLSMVFEPMPLQVGPLLHEIGVNELPIAFCHAVTSAIDRVGPDGTEHTDNGEVLGGHCRAVVGYDMDRGGGAFLIRNSWKGWGVRHPLAATDSRFAAQVDSFSWISFNEFVSPAFLQSADRLSLPPWIQA